MSIRDYNGVLTQYCYIIYNPLKRKFFRCKFNENFLTELLFSLMNRKRQIFNEIIHFRYK